MRQEQSTREKAGERRKGNFSSSLPRFLLSPHSSQDHLLRRLPTFQPTVQACFCLPALQATHVLSLRYICDRTFLSDQGPKLENFCFVIYLRLKFEPYDVSSGRDPCLPKHRWCASYLRGKIILVAKQFWINHMSDCLGGMTNHDITELD